MTECEEVKTYSSYDIVEDEETIILDQWTLTEGGFLVGYVQGKSTRVTSSRVMVIDPMTGGNYLIMTQSGCTYKLLMELDGNPPVLSIVDK